MDTERDGKIYTSAKGKNIFQSSRAKIQGENKKMGWIDSCRRISRVVLRCTLRRLIFFFREAVRSTLLVYNILLTFLLKLFLTQYNLNFYKVHTI